MNALRPGATGRTKNDVEVIRHLYLDFYDDGTEAVERLLSWQDLPPPNHRISSSPGKWQVVWKVEGFLPEQAERLQKWLVREAGADPAATDCARAPAAVLLNNHKYERPHFVSAERLSERVWRPEDFAEPDRRHDGVTGRSRSARPVAGGGAFSQSERDWVYAKRALPLGETQELVIVAIAAWRR